MFSSFLKMSPSLLLQVTTAIKQLVLPFIHTSGEVPSSSVAPHLHLDAGRTTPSVMEASVKMNGTNHQGRAELSSIMYPI